MRGWRAATIAAVAVSGLWPAGAAAHGHGSPVRIDVLSSRPDQVSGGDALVRLQAPPGLLRRLRLERNGTDVTGALRIQSRGGLTGVVDGLSVGANELTAVWHRHAFARLRVRNYPITGPIFSGPQQAPFVCKTNQPQTPLNDSLGEPIVDNQSGDGFRVLNPDGTTAGWSRDCSAHTVVDFLYRTTGGAWKALPAGGRPADMAQTTTLDGRTVDFIVRRERGTIDRFIYSYAMLAPAGASDTDTSLWNRRLVYAFDGGVAIGHSQGKPGSSSVDPDILGQGYAIVHSSGTDTNTHYNLQLGGEVALMTKERFVERYGVPLYTVGVGGSGGAIQQYVYGQNEPQLLDAGIAVKSYPDMTTQTIHVGDCELLEHYMDVTDAANPKWRNWDNREWLIGLSGNPAFPNPYTGQAGSDECVNGWRGLTPLALNPLFGTAGAGSERMDPAAMAAIRWTHWDDARNVYGIAPDGWARNPWDNTGVQYGLQALRDGHISPAEFLDLNAKVGTWKEAQDMVQEGQPFLPVGGFDPWSSRNMRLSPDGGVTPAPRRGGDVIAMRNAYEKGLYFDGDVDMPILDIRPYLEEKLDMHNAHQSFASRQRMLDFDGDASNQVIWFWGQNGGDRLMLPQAFKVMDEWLANLREHPWRGVGGNKPAGAVDGCFTDTAQTIASGPHVWDGILDHRPAGACTQAYPLHSTSRIVAGGPLRGGVYKCALQSVSRAIARGLYGSWRPSAAERARLEQIFPTGVCDYTRPDVGRPLGF